MQLYISISAISLSLGYLFFLLFKKGRFSLPPALAAILLSSSALELCDLMTVIRPDQLLIWKKYALLSESILPPIWLWFSLTYARQSDFKSIPILQRLFFAASPLFIASVIFLPITTFYYSPDFSSEKILFLGPAGFYFYLFLLIYMIIPLVNLEMTLASTAHISRWKIKFELLGAGVLLAVMIFYYSHALLFRNLNMNLIPARSILLIVAVIMMAYSRLLRGNGVRVYVSQQILYKSTALLAVGVYLIALGLMGEGMKYFGNGIERSMLITVAFLAGISLVIALLSETVRRKVKVFISRNFYRDKYDYRNQWLQFTDRLASSKSREDLFHSIVSGFCDTFGMECGALFLLEREVETYRLEAQIAFSTELIEFNRTDRIVDYIASNNWLHNSSSIPHDLCTKESSEIFTAHRIMFAVPLYLGEELGGFILLGGPLSSSESYNYEDFDLMITIARQASSALLNLTLSEQLARSREMAAIGRVSTFVMHDLKNLVAALSLMLENGKEFIDVPEFQKDLLDSLGSTVTKMNNLISKLKHLPEKLTLQCAPVDLLQLVNETKNFVKKGEFTVSGESVMALVDREEIQKVALNLMLNAIEACEGNKPVSIEVGINGTPFLKVKDGGCGMTEEFIRNELFIPFKSTKKRGLGIGLFQCKKIVEAHGGMIEVVSEVDRGTEFTVWLPEAVVSDHLGG